jgi:hypothetical protein
MRGTTSEPHATGAISVCRLEQVQSRKRLEHACYSACQCGEPGGDSIAESSKPLKLHLAGVP